MTTTNYKSSDSFPSNIKTTSRIEKQPATPTRSKSPLLIAVCIISALIILLIVYLWPVIVIRMYDAGWPIGNPINSDISKNQPVMVQNDNKSNRFTQTTPLVASDKWITENLTDIKRVVTFPSNWAFSKTTSTKQVYDYKTEDTKECIYTDYLIEDPEKLIKYNIYGNQCPNDGGCEPTRKEHGKVLKETPINALYRAQTVYEGNVYYLYDLGQLFEIESEKSETFDVYGKPTKIDTIKFKGDTEISSYGPSDELLKDSKGRVVWPSCGSDPYISLSSKFLILESEFERTLDKIAASFYKF